MDPWNRSLSLKDYFRLLEGDYRMISCFESSIYLEMLRLMCFIGDCLVDNYLRFFMGVAFINCPAMLLWPRTKSYPQANWSEFSKHTSLSSDSETKMSFTYGSCRHSAPNWKVVFVS